MNGIATSKYDYNEGILVSRLSTALRQAVFFHNGRSASN